MRHVFWEVFRNSVEKVLNIFYETLNCYERQMLKICTFLGGFIRLINIKSSPNEIIDKVDYNRDWYFKKIIKKCTVYFDPF